jgi:hypothetical protein
MRLQLLPILTCIFCILFLSGTAVAQVYYVPPVNDAILNNLQLASSLGNWYNDSDDLGNWHGSIEYDLSFYYPSEHPYPSTLLNNASVAIAGMSLMLDNGTYPYPAGTFPYPSYNLAVLVARGAQMAHLMSTSENLTCDNPLLYDECDFDGDGCAEYEDSANVSYVGTVTFKFRDIENATPFSSTLVQVPPYILDAMKSSSGTEQLTVNITGKIIFTYNINDQGTDCVNHPINITPNVSFSTSRNFTVYGTNKLFFLRAPVLREQWFRNNRFDVVVFSQAPLYHADIYLNGNRTRNLTLRTFEINSSSYGVQEIISSLSSPDGWSEAVNLATPTPLEAGNLSFAYIYGFNYSYEGIGQNNLSLVVNDSFLGQARYGEQLLSRMLSYNGTGTENGSTMPPGQVRPSAAFKPDYLASVELVLGLLALLFLLSFVNLWLLK